MAMAKAKALAFAMGSSGSGSCSDSALGSSTFSFGSVPVPALSGSVRFGSHFWPILARPVQFWPHIRFRIHSQGFLMYLRCVQGIQGAGACIVDASSSICEVLKGFMRGSGFPSRAGALGEALLRVQVSFSGIAARHPGIRGASKADAAVLRSKVVNKNIFFWFRGWELLQLSKCYWRASCGDLGVHREAWRLHSGFRECLD